MVGNNTLIVCEALLQSIVQEWIDRNFVTKPKVIGIRTHDQTSRTFEIKITDKDVHE